jgi:hypothetical protein
MLENEYLAIDIHKEYLQGQDNLLFHIMIDVTIDHHFNLN